MTFSEANKLDNAGFAEYVKQNRREWKAKMLAEGMEYWPTLDRWYPAGIKIANAEPGEFNI